MASAEPTTFPPGPPLPRWLQTIPFVFAPVYWLEANRRRYGDAVTFGTFFDPKFVSVFDPELVRQLFRASPEQLSAGEANAVLEPILGPRSVLMLDGAEHMRHRKLLLPPFHGERMRAYEQTILDATDRAIERWPQDRPFTLLPEMQAITLEVIASAVFGVEGGPRQEDLKERIRALLAPQFGSRFGALMSLITGGRWGHSLRLRFEDARRRVDEAIYAEVARRRRQPDLEQREDILSMLLLARDEDGSAMTDRHLRDELVTLLVAGHETTSSALAWLFELLLRNPVVRECLESELAAGDHVYLDAAIKETLRIRPVIPGIGRVVRGEPFRLGEYLIPPGIAINPSIAVMHRRADRYPQQHDFRPERFLGPDPPDTYAWIPFGGGTRRCLGASFATFEMRAVVRRVLERTDLRAATRRPERGVRRSITFVPKRGVPVILAAPPSPAERRPVVAGAQV